MTLILLIGCSWRRIQQKAHRVTNCISEELTCWTIMSRSRETAGRFGKYILKSWKQQFAMVV